MMNKQTFDEQTTKAAQLLRQDLGAQAREANIDALLSDAHALQALKLAMRLEPTADTLTRQLLTRPAKKSWFAWMDAWAIGGLTAATAAAAWMALAPGLSGPQQHLLAPQQNLIASSSPVSDVVYGGSFEPSADLFGGDFEG